MSGKTNESVRELISAYLDGALSGSERLQAEQLFASDASAARYLDQLRATQECLRSLAPSSMRSSIAEQVVGRARALAAAEGLPSDHHVLRGARSTHTVTPVLIPSSLAAASSVEGASQPMAGGDRGWADWIPRSNRLLWSSLVTAAAAILGMVALPNLFDPMPHAEPLISQVLPSGSVSPESLPLPNDIDGIGPGADRDVSPFDSIATADEAMRPDSSGGGGLPVAREDKELSRMQFEYFMTVDAAMSREAWESSYFETLLDKAGVPQSSPITTDAELIKVLDDSLVTVSAADSGGSSANRKAALLFVRANGPNVDNLLVAMSQDRAHFLSVSYNLSVNDNRKLLGRLLRKQSMSQADGDLGARVLLGSQETTANGELVPNFVAHDPVRAVDGLGLTDQLLGGQLLGGQAGLKLSPEPVTEVLIILREPPAE